MRRGTFRHAFVLACFSMLAVASLGITRDAQAQTQPKVHFEIAAQPLDRALRQFALQSKRQVIFDPASIPARNAAAIKGDLSPEEALKAILEGSGLVFTLGKGDTLVITPAAATTESGGSRDTSDSAPGAGPTFPESNKSRDQLNEIVVTGSHIRGEAASAAVLRTYDRAQIEESGVATLQDFAEKMTENLASVSAPSAAFGNNTGGVSQNGANSFFGSAFNIHGLGTGATLTLLNGHRLPGAGSAADFVDISLIPLIAIERVEVLTDGASAIYGADAISGVVNLIPRDHFDGAETEVRYGSATLGGAAQTSASQLFGKAWGSGSVMLAAQFDHSDPVLSADRSFIPTQAVNVDVGAKNQTVNVLMTGHQDIADATNVSFDAIYARRRFDGLSSIGTVPVDNSGQVEQYGGNVSLSREIARWEVKVNAGDYKTAQAVTTAYSFNGTPFATTTPADTTLETVGIGADGPLLTLASGEVKAALGADYRTEHLSVPASVTLPIVTTSNRDVTGVYGELRIPLVGAGNESKYMKAAAFSAAIRYDNYSDIGNTVNPRFGINMTPVEGVSLSGSYATSFRAPSQYYLAPLPYYYTWPAADSASATGVTDVLINSSQGAERLKPERASSFTLGVEWRPPGLEGLQSSVNYFHVLFRDRIGFPPSPDGSVLAGADLNQPALAPFVNRSPSAAEIQAGFNSPGFQYDIGGNGPGEVRAIFNDYQINIARSVESGIQGSARYRAAIPGGYVEPFVNLDYIISNEFQSSSGVPAVSLLNIVGQPLGLRGRGGVTWKYIDLTSSLSVNYSQSYRNPIVTPAAHVASWTTVDLVLNYEFRSDFRPLHGVGIVFAASNLFDAYPPRVDVPLSQTGSYYNIGFDAANASAVGRFVSLELRKR